MTKLKRLFILFALLSLKMGFADNVITDQQSTIADDWVHVESDVTQTLSLNSWMLHLASSIKNKRIRELFIPGAHDAATSRITTTSTIIGDDMPPALNHLKKIGVGFVMNKIIAGWAKAQDLSIYSLLQIGVRYLDIRIALRDKALSPFEKKLEYWTFHSLSGEPFVNVLKDIKKFLDMPNHQNEIIILDLQNIVGGLTDKLYDMIVTILGAECLGTEYTLREKTLAEIWKTKERVFVLNGSQDMRSYTKANNLIIERSIGLESFWPNASTSQEFKDRMEEYYEAWDPLNSKPIIVLQGQLTPDDATIKNGLNPLNQTAAKSLKELWTKWRYEFIKTLPYFFGKTKGAVIMTDFMDSVLAEYVIAQNIYK